MKLSLPHWYPGSVVVLVLSILDLCPPSYFERENGKQFAKGNSTESTVKVAKRGMDIKHHSNVCFLSDDQD